MTHIYVASRDHRRRLGAVPWYRQGGAPLPWGAWRAVGAASLASSYLDLTPNLNHLTAGVAPDWDPANGWKCNGSTHYLVTTFVPAQDGSQTLIVQYTHCTAGTNQYLAGCRSSAANNRFYLAARNSSGTEVVYGQGMYSTAAPQQAAGNLCVAGAQGYCNGVAEGGTISPFDGPQTYPVYIGCQNYNGFASNLAAVYIRAVAIWDVALTAAQVLAVATVMATL